MKPFVRGCVGAALCVALCGCGGSQARVWRSARFRTGTYTPAGQSIYTPPVEPPSAPSYQTPVEPDIAPPVRPGDLQPAPTLAPTPVPAPAPAPMPAPAPAPMTLRLEEGLPGPPTESEESVQFLYPAPPSSMPNALYPEESKPVLEQSSAERPVNRQSSEVLGEGKIALKMRGHSTFAPAADKPVRLLRIEQDQIELPQGLMQVRYEPLLAPVPAAVR